MLEKLEKIRHLIGNTPIHTIEVRNVTLSIKLEYFNLFGSIKDRPAFNIIYEAVKEGSINSDTTIIESSSGNFAVSLASICHYLGLSFIAVVDTNINKSYLQLLQLLCSDVVMISEKDVTGGYLINRINKVESLCIQIPNSYWTNQYNNPNNYKCYYHGLGKEILLQVKNITHMFVAVSTTGTLVGISQCLKEANSAIKVIAVDIEGSVIFNQPSQSRYISGLGSSIVPPLLEYAKYDGIVHVTHGEIVEGCRSLFHDALILAGGSAGAVYQGIRKYFGDDNSPEIRNVAMCCPDRGNAYLDTIYNNDWCSKF